MPKWTWWGLLVIVVAGGVVWWSQPAGEEPARDGPAPEPGERDAPEPEDAPGLLTTKRAPVPEPPPSRAPLPEGAVRVFGTVVMPDEKPAVAASVDVNFALAFSEGTSTDATGAFELVIEREAMSDKYMAALRVRTRGHGLIKHFSVRTNPRWPQAKPVGPEIDLGTLVLEAGSSLDLHTTLPSGATGPVTVWLLLSRAWGAGALFTKVEADAAGRASAEGLPPGTWRILASASGAGRGEAFVKLPRKEPGVVEIELPEERVGTLTVLDKDTDAPIEGATVYVQEFVQAPSGNFGAALIPPPQPAATDAQGRIEFRGLNALSSLTIFVTAEGYPTTTSRHGIAASAMTHIRRSDTDVTVKLQKARTISWPVVDGPEVPAPSEGTRITLKRQAGAVLTPPDAGVMEGGHLVVGGWGAGYAAGLAVAPDGSMARLWCKDDEVEGPEIHFVPARTIEVTLRYDDGEPAEGLFINVVNQGNNPLAKPTPTDAEGKARIEGLYGGGPRNLVEVRVSEVESAWGGTKIATVDLSEGDGQVEGTVRRVLPVTLRIRIDGKAALPPITEKAPTGGIGITLGALYGTDFEADEERAEIRFRWRPPMDGQDVWLSVTLRGYLPYSEKRPSPTTQEPWVFDVALEPAGSIVVTGKPPKDMRRQRVQVQQWDAETKGWATQHLRMSAMGGYARLDADGQCVLQPLPAGRYRVIDVANFVSSRTVEVIPGQDPPQVVLDASKAGFIRGVVEAPEGVDRRGLRVLADGGPDFGDPFRGAGMMGGAPPPKGLWTHTNEKGEFWLRVPGTGKLELRPEGLGFVPAPEGGRVAVTGLREGVILKLVRGAMARLRFARKLTTYINPGRPRALQVAFYEGKVEGDPAKEVSGSLDGEGVALEFGLPPPGVWTVWIDASPFQPVVLEDVTFGKEDNDLGVVEVSEGTKVTVEVLLKPGTAMPRMYLSAYHLGKPAYSRQASSGSRTTFTLTGLGPGRFRIRSGSHMGGGGRVNEEIEVDGTGEIKRVIDLGK